MDFYKVKKLIRIICQIGIIEIYDTVAFLGVKFLKNFQNFFRVPKLMKKGKIRFL